MLRTIANRARISGVQLNAIESRVGPHVADDTRNVNFEENRMLGHRCHHQNTGVELDPKGVQAARQDELDFATRLERLNRGPRRRLSRRWAEHRSECGGSLATMRIQRGQKCEVRWWCGMRMFEVDVMVVSQGFQINHVVIESP